MKKTWIQSLQMVQIQMLFDQWVPKIVEFGPIWPKLWSNLVKFDHESRIRLNSTFEFEIWNLKNWNSNEFERIRLSLYYIQFLSQKSIARYDTGKKVDQSMKVQCWVSQFDTIPLNVYKSKGGEGSFFVKPALMCNFQCSYITCNFYSLHRSKALKSGLVVITTLVCTALALCVVCFSILIHDNYPIVPIERVNSNQTESGKN